MRLRKTTKALRAATLKRRNNINDAAKLKAFIIATGFIPPMSMIFSMMPDDSFDFHVTITGGESGSGGGGGGGYGHR